MRRLDIRPNRELGQHFLADDNILDVIGRSAELEPDDVVLEIGGGLGVLSEYLAGRVRYLHVIETDARLKDALSEALADAAAQVLIADVMDADLTALEPAPNKVVANLPYGVAVPALVRTIGSLPSARLWCVMVQREIADRLTASPGTRVYGAPSVIVQLSCSVEFLRPIARTVFHPRPNVDSALVRLRRTAPPPGRALRVLVKAAFAHRRKALPRSLELSLGARDVRLAAREALEELGHPADERAERLSPQEFETIAERLAQWL
jgi:16S rRNA (adenine1518-N6/adenine1519-N6)-dimethyltransferase